MKHLLQYQILLGFMFIIFAFRETFPLKAETGVEFILFLTILWGIILGVRKKHFWMAYAMYVLALFYNPLFLVFYDLNQNILADVIVGVSILFLALLQSRSLPSLISVSQGRSL